MVLTCLHLLLIIIIVTISKKVIYGISHKDDKAEALDIG